VLISRDILTTEDIENRIWPIKWHQRQWPWMTLKVIYRLQAFSDAIRRTFMQHFTRFQLRVCSLGSSALAELLVYWHDGIYWRNYEQGSIGSQIKLQGAPRSSVKLPKYKWRTIWFNDFISFYFHFPFTV